MKQPIAVLIIVPLLYLFDFICLGIALIGKKKRPPQAIHAFKLGLGFWGVSSFVLLTMTIVYFFVIADGPSAPFWIGVTAGCFPLFFCSVLFSNLFLYMENETVVVSKALFRVIRIDLAKPGVQVHGARDSDVEILGRSCYMTIWITDPDGKRIRIYSKWYEERFDFVGFLQECQEIQKRNRTHEQSAS